MARFQFCSDILSPIHSDISFNDVSAFSFGSLSGTPDQDKDIESPINICTEKDSDMGSIYKKAMQETAGVFDVVVNDIKKQSDINSAREERFKESYEMLKQSMDDVFYKKADLNSSILSPVSKDEELESPGSKIHTAKVDKKSKNVKVSKKSSSFGSETHSKISSKKIERTKKSNSDSVDKELKKSNEVKNSRPPKLSPDNLKLPDGCKPKNVKTASSSIETSKEKRAAFKDSHKKNEAKESRAAKDYKFRCQQKIVPEDTMPVTENKSLSIEKSIQITVGMEMDKLRQFVLDQNICLRKDIFKLQDMAKKQTEVTEYLFLVIDNLLETNKKLVSKCK